MTGEVIFDLLARSMMLIAAVWLATAAIRRAGGSAAMRHMAWLLGFAGLAALPLLSAIAPSLPVPVLPAVEPVESTSAPALPRATSEVDPGVPLTAILQLLYLAIAAALLVRPVGGRMLLARMWREARPVEHPEHLRLLDALSEHLGIRRNVGLRIASGPTVPMTWGVLRPRVLLPADAQRWSAEQWRFVLLHELGHVARHDSASRLGSAMLCALYWPNPAVWLAAERLRLEQEHACDDLVLANGAEAGIYARNLLGAARTLRPCGHALTFASAMIRQSELERRLLAIVGDGPRRRPGRSFVAGGAMLAVAVTTLAAVTVPVEAPSARPAERPITRPIPVRPALEPPAAPIVGAVAAPTHKSRRLLPTSAPAVAIVVQAISPLEPVSAASHEHAIARYREAKAHYLIALGVYRDEIDDYRRAKDQYHREVADYRRKLAAYEAAPFGPAPVAPIAPVAPVAPVVPVAPPVPPIPPVDPGHS